MNSQDSAAKSSESLTETFTAEQGFQHASKLKGKVVFITGASSGFGRDFAIKAASFGAKVVISDIQLPSQVQIEIRATGGIVEAIACDVTSWDQQVAAFEFAEAKFGSVCVVVANAGIAETGGEWLADVVEENGLPKQPRDKTLQVNLIGVLYTSKLAFFYLRKNPAKKGKSLILVSSMAGHYGIPSAPLYSASKHAVIGLFRSLNSNAIVEGITLNCVCPWFVDTPILQSEVRLAIAGLPLATVNDVTSAVVRAASDPEFTGNMVVVDAQGCLVLPTDNGAGYYAEFNKRAKMSIGLNAWIRDMKKILVLALKLKSGKVQLVGMGFLLLAFARYFR